MGRGPGKEWFTQLRVLLLAVVSWFAVTVVGELIGNQANDTPTGQLVGHYVLLTAIIVVPVASVTWLVLAMRERRRRRGPLATDETAPSPKVLAPPVWHPRPPLCDRENEVATGARLLRANRIVVVIGPRDVGTSSVGQAVVQRMIDQNDGDPRTTTRFDLRSRSTSGPDDVVATATRVVAPFGVDEPADESDEVLARVARELVERFRASGGILLLDNVSAPEQVRWLVREWPSDGPLLVVVGETALGELVPAGTVEVGPMALEHLRELWWQELNGTAPPKTWFARNFSKWRRVLSSSPESADLDELLRATFGRPGAVKAIAREVGRSSSVTLPNVLGELRRDGLVDGPLERVWRVILANLRESLSPDAAWLLSALAELPVTGLIKGAVAAMLGVSEPVALEELRKRDLVEEVDGRYRLPQEIRRAIEGTTKEEERRAVAKRAVPALVRFYREFAEPWAARLSVDPKGAAAWFRVSEPSFRPLYANTYLDDDLLGVVLDDLCAIADALDRWYVRQRLASPMLAVNSGLYGLADRARRTEQAALAAIRVAAAHRMGRRYGEAATHLDVARTHIESLPESPVRSELDSREQVARALLALERESGFAEAYAGLTPTESPAVLLNLAALCLARGMLDEAATHLARAEALAQDLGDAGAWAHSQELLGICLSGTDLVEAVRRWQLARTTFNHVGEEQGEARCLQHLGAAALADPVAAGQLARGAPEPLARAAAERVALAHLTLAKSLRVGQPDTGLVDRYLAQVSPAT